MTTRFLLVSFALVLSIVAGCSDMGDPVATDNGPIPGLSVNDVTVVEGDSAQFVITIAPTSSSDVEVSFVTNGGTATASTDYNSRLGFVTIPADSSSVTIGVATNLDSDIEGAENFNFIIGTTSSVTVADSLGVCTISQRIHYDAQVQPLLQTCLTVGCHGTPPISGGLDFGTTADYGMVRNAIGDHGPIIVAGDASASNLYGKLTNPPVFVNRMPLGKTPFTADEQAIIRDWINQGAADFTGP